jgi:glycine cleavage system H protein
MQIPSDLQYTKGPRVDPLRGTDEGSSDHDFAQDALGDVVFVELPAVGTRSDPGQTFGCRVEQDGVDFFAPVAGQVVEVNEELRAVRSSSTRSRTGRMDDQGRAGERHDHGLLDAARIGPRESEQG